MQFRILSLFGTLLFLVAAGSILDPAGAAHSCRNTHARKNPGVQRDPENNNACGYKKFHRTILSPYLEITSIVRRSAIKFL